MRGPLAAPLAPKSVLTPYSGSGLYVVSPQYVPILAGTFTPRTPVVEALIAACGTYAGSAGVQFVFAFCDNTLGRLPHPKTLTEFNTPPAGITYYKAGTVWPRAGQRFKATAVGQSGPENTIAKLVRIPGLVPGHIYQWELLAGVVGGAGDAAPLDTATTGRPAALRANNDMGQWKVYLASDTNKRLDIAYVQGGLPLSATNTIKSGQITLPNNPKDIVASPTQNYLAALQQTSNAISVIDPITDLALGTYTPGFAPTRGAITADGLTLLFVGATSLNTMTLSSGAFGTAVSTTGTAVDVKVNPAGTAVWVLDQTNHAIRGWNLASGVLGTAIGSVVLTGTLTPTLSRLCISADGAKAWVTDDANGVLIEVNLTGLSQTRTIALSQAGPYVGCEFFPDSASNCVLVVSQAGNAANSQIQQVNVLDWTIWTTWQNVLTGGPAGATAANATSGGLCVVADGTIFVSDVANNAVNEWNGTQFAVTPNYFLTQDYMDVLIHEAA